MEQSTITVDIKSYENFWALLMSPDKENTVVALTILNNANFRESLPYILLLFKYQTDAEREVWIVNAPDLFKKLEGIGIKISDKISHAKIIELTKEYCDEEAIQFVLDKFTVLIQKYLIEWGFNFLEDAEIKIKMKNE